MARREPLTPDDMQLRLRQLYSPEPIYVVFNYIDAKDIYEAYFVTPLGYLDTLLPPEALLMDISDLEDSLQEIVDNLVEHQLVGGAACQTRH